MLEAMWDERGQLVQEMQEGTVSSRGYGGILAEGAVMIALSISNFNGIFPELSPFTPLSPLTPGLVSCLYFCSTFAICINLYTLLRFDLR